MRSRWFVPCSTQHSTIHMCETTGWRLILLPLVFSLAPGSAQRQQQLSAQIVAAAGAGLRMFRGSGGVLSDAVSGQLPSWP